jgi:hypothetical protein
MARYAPGLPPSELERMTPEETRHVRREVERALKAEVDERIAHTTAIVRSGGGRLL